MFDRNAITPLFLALLGATASPALLAASILVNTAEDELNNDGDCSLREAVESANTNSAVDNCNAGNTGADSITLLVGGTMTLGMGELVVNEALEILGVGIDNLTINAGPDSRHFTLDMPDNSHDFAIRFVTLSGGDVSATGGGSILAEQVGTLTLDGVRLSNNQATSLIDNLNGGAIEVRVPVENNSRLEIYDSILENNTAGYRGGAVHIEAGTAASAVETIDIQRSLFRDNLSNGSGGAIYAIGVPTTVIADSVFETNTADFDGISGVGEFGGAILWRVSDLLTSLLLVERSTFTGNSSRSAGGAIAAWGGLAAVVNSTFDGNREHGVGGDVFDLAIGTELFLFNSTLTNNGSNHWADVAIEICDTCKLTTTHSIIWSDWQPSKDCDTNTFGIVASNGYNIDGSGTCTGHATDLPSTNPKLWPLGDYGDNASGITIPSRVPYPDSPAVDAGNTSCPGLFGVPLTTDQRGESRPVAGPGGGSAICDIGSTEYQDGSDPVPRTVTVTLAGTGTGQVVSNPSGINCPGQDCVAEFADGSTVGLSALTGPEPGVAFAGWGGDCSGTGSCVLTLDGDRSVTATFNSVTDELFADRFEDGP